MANPNRTLGWLIGEWQWPYASLLAACLLIVLAPLWFFVAGTPLGWIYLQLPMYMLHQWEEHAGDRFRLYINRHVGNGREALTPAATFWINVLGVWVVDVAGLYLGCCVRPSLGLMAIYLPLLNSLGHIGPAIRRREYNPGLWTSLGLFVPVGGWSLYAVSTATGANWTDHAIGMGIAVGVHVAIIVHVVRRLGRLSRAEGAAALS